VSITILPDEQGRFGFNVKGGIDQKLPIIVSRVGANTPADRLVANCSKQSVWHRTLLLFQYESFQ
jgi:hypothetical protein